MNDLVQLDKLGIDAHISGSLSTFCRYTETLLTGLCYHIYVTHFSKNVWFSTLMFIFSTTRHCQRSSLYDNRNTKWWGIFWNIVGFGRCSVNLGEFESIYHQYVYLIRKCWLMSQKLCSFQVFYKICKSKVQSLCVMITMSTIHYQVLFYCFAGG